MFLKKIMPGNTFGKIFRITTAGQSHGPANVVIIDGMPPGIEIDLDFLQAELDRRRPGQSKITTQRKESDTAEILAGVFEGKTTGDALCIKIDNQDQRSKDYSKIKDKYRPGHADYSFDAKYGHRDYRGGGRSSARETNVRVAAGAVAKMLLNQKQISVLAYVKQVGEVVAKNIPSPADLTLDQIEANPVRCPDSKAAAEMIALIDKVRKETDSIGGIAEIVVTGLKPGLGEPVFDKLRADLGKALLSLPAVLGVEFGNGFEAAKLKGSENNDVFTTDSNGQVTTKSNRHGGMLGGISTGMPLIIRCVVKPTSSLAKEQPTITKDGEPTTIRTLGRHDPCLLPRFIPMAEAMVAITLVDHHLRQFAQRSVFS